MSEKSYNNNFTNARNRCVLFMINLDHSVCLQTKIHNISEIVDRRNRTDNDVCYFSVSFYVSYPGVLSVVVPAASAL